MKILLGILLLALVLLLQWITYNEAFEKGRLFGYIEGVHDCMGIDDDDETDEEE